MRQRGIRHNWKRRPVVPANTVKVSLGCVREEKLFQVLCHKRVIIFIYSLTTSWQEDGKSKNKSELTNIIRVIFTLSVNLTEA